MPSGHALHAAAPPVLYCPAAHGTAVALVDPAGHAYPAAHGPLHDDVVSDVALPNVPPGHELHTDTPPVLYGPTAQGACVALVEPSGQ